MVDKIKCPDCGIEIEEVVIERYQSKVFEVDYENKNLVPVDNSEWNTDDDHAIRCPGCDSLNIYSDFQGYSIEEPDEPVKIDERIPKGGLAEAAAMAGAEVKVVDLKGVFPENTIQIMSVTNVTQERIKDLLITAFEGGSNYWYFIREFVYPAGQTQESLGIECQHDGELIFRGGHMIIDDVEDGEQSELSGKILDMDAIKRGLNLMAEKYPKHWNDFIQENEDADTADVFLQLAVYGDIVYG